MEFSEYPSDQGLKDALIAEIGTACPTILQSRHRVLVQIATSTVYPLKLLTALFREYGGKIKRSILFGVIIGAEPATSEDDEHTLPFEFGLQLRNRLPFLKFQYHPYWELQKVLGTTQDFVILDLTAQFNPDDISVAIESVAGPGLIILITPPLEEWRRRITRFIEQLNYYAEQPPAPRFISHFIQVLQASNNVIVVEEDANRLGRPSWAPGVPSSEDSILAPQPKAKKIEDLAITKDQRETLANIEGWLNSATGTSQENSHCYLHASRGRGKTTVLGLSVASFLSKQAAPEKEKNKISVLITSPELTQVQPAFIALQNAFFTIGVKFQVKKVGELLSEISCPRGTFFYAAPDSVVERKRLGIIFIDEAGNIPLPILEQIPQLGIPCLWSTTTHGYEGVGRGFALKFLPWLARKGTVLQTLTMASPIRYGIDDPIERLLFEAFFLNSDIQESPPALASSSDLSLAHISEGSREGGSQIREIFGLLISAHYKTRPSDFVPIFDLPSWKLWVGQNSAGETAGAILTIPEGGLAPEVADHLANAPKERQGALVSWVIALHHQAPAFVSHYRGARIARIAVHPLLQRQGIGLKILQDLEAEHKKAGLDFVATSFGATPSLLEFWLRAGFIPLHIGLKRSAATGEYSVVMIKALNPETQPAIAVFAVDFKVKLIEWLRDLLYDLAPTTLLPLLLFQHPSLVGHFPPNDFAPSEARRLGAYCQDVLKFKAVSDVIRKLVIRFLYDASETRPTLEKKTLEILVAKLQSRSWKTVQETTHVLAQRAYGMAREGIKKLAQYYQIVPPSSENT